MALTATLFSGDSAERRSNDRRPVGLPSTLRDRHATPHIVLVRDLSRDGCLIETVAPRSPGEAVGIGLPGVGRQDARIVRADGDRYGCVFDRPLSDDALAVAFMSDPVVAGDFGQLPGVGTADEPAVRKWHPAVRLTILVAAATTLWTAIIAAL